MPRGRPKKKTVPKTFDLLSDGDYASQVKEAMMTMATKRKAQVTVDSYENISKNYVELRNNVYFQHCIGMKGLPHGTLIEIIGQDGIGKTSLVLTMAGHAMMQNSPFLLIESEAKPMDKKNPMGDPGQFAPATPMTMSKGGSMKRKRSIDGIAQRGKTRLGR